MVATIVISLLLLILFTIYRNEDQRRLGMKQQELEKLYKDFASLLQQNQLMLWLYDIRTGTYSWMDDDHATFMDLQPKQFAERYSEKVFQYINKTIQRIIRHEISETTLRIAHIMKDGSKRYLALDMSVLRTNESGDVEVIATFQTDITDSYLRDTRNKEIRDRYESIFSSATIDMVYYDSLGHINNMNQRACETFGIDLESAKQAGISVEMAINEPDINSNSFDSFYATQFRPSTLAVNNVKSEKLKGLMCYEIQIMPVYDSRHHMICAYGSGRDVTELADTYYTMQDNIRKAEKANAALSDYISNIDYALKVGGIRLAEYDPKKRILTIFSEIGHVQLTVTPERAMRLVDGSSEAITRLFFNNMDRLSTVPFNNQIRTIIRQPGGHPLSLHLSFTPTYDSKGRIYSYYGMIRDITMVKVMERQLATETVRARQEESQKKASMRNLSFDIRTQLTNVVGFAEQYQSQSFDSDDEQLFVNQIKDSAAQLLSLVKESSDISEDAGNDLKNGRDE